MDDKKLNNDNISTEDNALVRENRNLGIQLTLAQAFGHLCLQAYDALLHHDINYRNLKEFKDTTLLDKGHETPSIEDGRVHVMDYIKRVSNALRAAIARKNIRKV